MLASAGNPGQTVTRPASADSSSSRQASSARALSTAAAGQVSEVVGVPQECVECTHRPPLGAGEQQESIVEVPGLSPRQNAAESVTGSECPIHLHGEFSIGDDPVATSIGRFRA